MQPDYADVQRQLEQRKGLTLPYSQYTFVKPTESMGSDAWVECNIAALRFFGGVPRVIVPGNLKCAEQHLQLSGTRIGVEPPEERERVHVGGYPMFRSIGVAPLVKLGLDETQRGRPSACTTASAWS